MWANELLRRNSKAQAVPNTASKFSRGWRKY